MASSASQQHIAFFGLGLMGTGMARRLLSAGHKVTVHNRTKAKADALVAEGATWAASPREAAASADVVISMVADDSASRALWLGHDGALADIRAGTLALECSTVSPTWVDELRAAALAADCRFLDAPVTGSRPQAAAGELIFMVGGDEEAFSSAQPLLKIMGKKIVHVGGPGSGARVKLLNNFLAGVQAASLAEALELMERSGVNIGQAMEVILHGAPGSPMINSLYGRVAKGDTEKYFRLKLMAKDLAYAQEEAAVYRLALRTVAAASAVFQSAVEKGRGESDVSAVLLPPR